MSRTLVALLFCLSVPSATAYAGPHGLDSLMRRYDASAVAQGKIQVSTTGDVAWVSGATDDGPWLEVWRLTDGEWKMVAEAVTTPLAPIRFGVKRDRRCRTS